MFIDAIAFALVIASILPCCNSFASSGVVSSSLSKTRLTAEAQNVAKNVKATTQIESTAMNKNRRDTISGLCTMFTAGVLVSTIALPSAAAADTENEPEVTDKIYIDLKSPTDTESRRIVIGLYGKVAPKSCKALQQLVSRQGLSIPCKPKDESRVVQKEQLEANKVYRSCIENESQGVTYEYGTVWRIIKDYRIDVGSVAGKFIAREFPNWNEDKEDAMNMPLTFGTVTVQKGNESGFGFAIQTTPKPRDSKKNGEDVIVIGRVLDGLTTVVADLNETPVVKSSKVNYMALTGSGGLKAAPSRACSYGNGKLYCNEFKPLKKISIVSTGVL